MPAPDQATQRGIAFLRSAQATNGSFVTQLSAQKHPFQPQAETTTTFALSLVLQALATVDGAHDIREKLATCLLRQQSPNGGFNYWPREAIERRSRPYPDDLDDTACALAGLYHHNPDLIDAAQLAKLVQLLIVAEAEVGGPYKTWLATEKGSAMWQDVDLVVNCNIAHLLQLVAEPLPKLQTMLFRAVATGNFTSPYYPIPMVVMYFLARACPTDAAATLAKQVLAQQKKGAWQTPAQTAMACTALSRLGAKTKQSAAVAYLLQQQFPDGSWPAECIWLDKRHGGRNIYAGSPALTTAFVLEALSFLQPKPSVRSLRKKADSWQPTFQKTVKAVKRRLTSLGKPLRPHTQALLERLLQGASGREIVLLPHWFLASLANRLTLTDDFLTSLSLANTFGWMAYTAQDDFLDGEGQAPLLPVANVAMRLSLEYFAQTVPANKAFQQYVQTTFNRIDAANAWEVAHCRFDHDEQIISIATLPKYPSAVFLAERSIGHCLTPLAVLAAAGVPVHSPQAASFIKGFRHYLAARQLNDDLHDWQQDARNGQISYVVARLLQGARITPGRHSLAALAPQLERYFWHEALGDLCAETSRQLAASRRAFAASTLLRPDSMFLQLVSRLEQSIARTINEQKQALTFLRHYSNKNNP